MKTRVCLKYFACYCTIKDAVMGLENEWADPFCAKIHLVPQNFKHTENILSNKDCKALKAI